MIVVDVTVTVLAVTVVVEQHDAQRVHHEPHDRNGQ